MFSVYAKFGFYSFLISSKSEAPDRRTDGRRDTTLNRWCRRL